MVERITHSYDGELVVFLIGMRVHQAWRLDVVVPAARAMPRMLAELYRNQSEAARGEAEDLGFLGARTAIEGMGVTTIQYWRSTEQLYRYASAPERNHRSAWLDFYRSVKKAPDAVTIWHETYSVPAGGHESIYAGPRPFGLASLGDGPIPVAKRGEHARQRMQRQSQ